MIEQQALAAMDKDKLPQLAETLTPADIGQLVQWLAAKDDATRYPSFLLLQYRSALAGDVYPYWQTLQDKLSCDNSYQRNIGLTLLAANARWDEGRRMRGALDDYLKLLHDEKPITIRYCLQGLAEIARSQPELQALILPQLLAYDLLAVKETMRKVVLLDIINVLAVIRHNSSDPAIESFLLDAISGAILDQKSKKEVEALLRQ
jgi:hypothetical protein